MRERVDLESLIHSDGWRGYDGLVDLGCRKHFRVERGNNEFANKHSHINGIESFRAYAKTRLARFRGLQKHTFYFFHLKECEVRFNHIARKHLSADPQIAQNFSSQLVMTL